MNMKLKKVLDEIQKTEERITEWQEHLRELNIRKKQLEDAEIIKQPGTSGSIGQNPEWNGCFSVSDGRNYCAGYKKRRGLEGYCRRKKTAGT